MYVELKDVINALDQEQIVPFFQPIVKLRTGEISGFEVLARWHHPIHGPILPANFISLAENNGLIGTLMEQVLRKAFRAALTIPPPLTLSINVSPIQMHFLTLPTEIREIAEEFSFSLDRLIVEITESALVYELDRAQKVAADLKEMGCRLALDDFGTGFSSLRHLSALPFDELKIDRSFVASMLSERESRKIVAAVAGLCHSLRLESVGEGIEDEDHAQMLVLLDCDFGQGYFYGRPAPAESLPAMIEAAPRTLSFTEISPAVGGSLSSLESKPTQRLSHLQAIYDGAPVGLCFLDCNLRYVSLNRRLAEMNKLSVEQHLGRSVAELFPHWFSNVEPYLCRSLAGEPVGGVQIRKPALLPGEHDSFVIASYQPVWDEAGEVIGISISSLDITEHIRVTKDSLAEHQPQPAELHARTSWIMTPNGLPLQESAPWPRQQNQLQLPSHHPSWLLRLHPEDLPEASRMVIESMRTGDPFDIQYRVVGLSESWRLVRAQGTAHFGPGGEITRWYGTIDNLDTLDPLLQTERGPHSAIAPNNAS